MTKTTDFEYTDKENLASAKPSGDDQGWSSVPVAKDGEKGPPAVALIALMRWPWMAE